MTQNKIPFTKAYLTTNELRYMEQALQNGQLSGDGAFTKACHEWLKKNTKCQKALLTHSCTAALEIAALLLDLKPGDEVIMPSYTFVSTANAFVLRGAIPVFVDIREDTLNIDERLIESAINEKTKAIVCVHYAGVSCDMDAIKAIAIKYNLSVIEDAAQGVEAYYKDQALGSIGDLGTYSFHATKNIISGEGGALLINNPLFASRAEIIREKGTDRSQFIRGEVDKYTWQDIGSSFLPSDVTAAFLLAQLEEANKITQLRLSAWHYYHEYIHSFESKNLFCSAVVPADCRHNGHIYHVLIADHIEREKVINELKTYGIYAVSHYIPLHLSNAGQRYGRINSTLSITERCAEKILRLPLWSGITQQQQDYVIEKLMYILHKQA